MTDFLKRLFGIVSSNNSKDVAKERLQLVLVHDRATLSPHLLEALKEDLIEVISKYMEIDREDLEVELSTEDNSVALVANIPVVNMKREYQEK